MKKQVIISIIATLLITSCNQKADESGIPKEIIEAFNANFKGSTVESWDKENDGGYEAEFELNGVESSATFSSKGKLLETEQEIEESSLPNSITEYLKTNYSDKNIDEIAKITTGEGLIKYEVEIEKADLIFDDKGNILK